METLFPLRTCKEALFCRFFSTTIAAEIVAPYGALAGLRRLFLCGSGRATTAASTTATTPAACVGGRLDTRGGGRGAAGAVLRLRGGHRRGAAAFSPFSCCSPRLIKTG